MNTFYEYWGKAFNEMDEVMEDTSGVVFAASLNEAVECITNWYDDKNIDEITIRRTDMQSVYECPVNKEEE